MATFVDSRSRNGGSLALDIEETIDDEVLCPHCRRRFAAQLLASGHLRGFKCPQCRLFVPLERRPKLLPEPSSRKAARADSTGPLTLNTLTGLPDP